MSTARILSLMVVMTSFCNCGGVDEAIADGGIEAQGGASTTTGCAIPCAAAYMDIYLVVTGPGDAGQLSDVQATLVGPATITLSCEQDNGAAVCRWPSGPVTDGNYSLSVTAPGFATSNTNATVTTIHGSPCGCDAASLQPSSVVLSASTAK